MKNALFLLALVTFLGACTNEKKEKTTLTLTAENAGFEQAEMTLMTDFISNSRETLTATEDENGLFTFEADIDQPQMVFLTLDKKRISVYLNQGGNLHIDADMEDWDATLAFSGDYAAENRFLQAYQQEVEPSYGQSQTFNQFRNASADDFVEYTDKMQSESLAYLEDFDAENELSKAFKDFFATDIRYTVYTHRLNYAPYYNYFNQQEPELPEGYYDFIEEAKSYTEDNFHIRSFANFFNEYVLYFIRTHPDEIPEELTSFEQQMWVAENKLSGKATFFAQANAINEAINWGEFTEAETAFFSFRDQSPHKEYTDALQVTYEDALKVAPGNPAPEFTLVDIDGNEVTLASLNGKVVYLDFWASWCAPCMREVPYAKELKKEFDGEDDLVFLYISVDEDEQAWRKTVAEKEIKGVHLNIKGMRHDIAQQYNVKGVPSFFIIDREGIIYDNNPGRPSSGETITEQLKTALEVQS